MRLYFFGQPKESLPAGLYKPQFKSLFHWHLFLDQETTTWHLDISEPWKITRFPKTVLCVIVYPSRVSWLLCLCPLCVASKHTLPAGMLQSAPWWKNWEMSTFLTRLKGVSPVLFIVLIFMHLPLETVIPIDTIIKYQLIVTSYWNTACYGKPQIHR